MYMVSAKNYKTVKKKTKSENSKWRYVVFVDWMPQYCSVVSTSPVNLRIFLTQPQSPRRIFCRYKRADSKNHIEGKGTGMAKIILGGKKT